MDSEQSNGSYIWQGQFVKKVKTNDSTRYWEPKRSICLKNRSEKKSVLVISKNFF